MSLALGVFDGDEIVGYTNSLISESLHYRGVVICQNDAIYLRANRRRGALGLRLMRETERVAYMRGADMVVWQCKPDTPMHALLARGRYALQDLVYTRALNGH
jgi:hypothetical protein